MAIAYVQSTGNSGSGISSLGVAFGSNVTAVSTISTNVRLGLSLYDHVADSQANTYGTPIAVTSGTNHTNTHTAAHNAASGATTVTAYASSSTTIRFAIHEYSTSTALTYDADDSGNTGTSTTSWTTSTAVNTAATALAISSESTDTDVGSVSYDAGPAYTGRQFILNRLHTGEKILSSTGTQQNTGTFPTSENYGAMLVLYKENVGGGGLQKSSLSLLGVGT